jgi:hypothetical protein
MLSMPEALPTNASSVNERERATVSVASGTSSSGGSGSWRDHLIEWTLNKVAARPQIANPAWHVSDAELREVVIHWPSAYNWPQARYWMDTLFYGLRRLVRVEVCELPQPYCNTVLTEFIINGKSHDVAIDYADDSELQSKESVQRCSVYFKMQYLRGGYDLPNVLPGGYVSDGRKLYLHLGRLRRLRDQQRFACDVTGRFSLDFAPETRKKAIGLLKEQNDFKFEGGLTKVSYLDFLKEIARAKICIDLPGRGDFCFRLVNYMAVGACIVAAPHHNAFHVPLVDRQHIAYIEPDFSNLVELCNYYLKNEDAREQMCRESRSFFEQYLHKDNLAAYYIHSCLARLKD